MENLISHAKERTVCQCADVFSVYFHFAFGSYIANLSETEDVLFLKRVTNTPMQLYNCHVQKRNY